MTWGISFMISLIGVLNMLVIVSHSMLEYILCPKHADEANFELGTMQTCA